MLESYCEGTDLDAVLDFTFAMFTANAKKAFRGP